MLVTQSCIVADPPEYRAPGKTRPVLDVYGAVPTATRALIVYKGNPAVGTPFSVRVRSEDAGEPLRALFFLDYQIKYAGVTQPGEVNLVSKTIPASTYDDTGRVIQYTWNPANPATTRGCHFISLVVAHRDSFLVEDNDHLDPRYADEDAAIVTWTVNVDPLDEGTLVNCPSADGTEP
jgi:hypothetical protein